MVVEFAHTAELACNVFSEVELRALLAMPCHTVRFGLTPFLTTVLYKIIIIVSFQICGDILGRITYRCYIAQVLKYLLPYNVCYKHAYISQHKKSVCVLFLTTNHFITVLFQGPKGDEGKAVR